MNTERVEAAAKWKAVAMYDGPQHDPKYWAVVDQDGRKLFDTLNADSRWTIDEQEAMAKQCVAALTAADSASGERVDKENWTASFLDSINTHLRECGVFHGHDQVKNAADGLSVLRSIFGHANSDRSELSTAHKSLAVLREVCNAREQHYFEPTVGTLHRLNLAEAAMDSSQALTIPKAIGNETSVKVEQVTHATLDAKSLYEISVCANALDGLTRLSGPDANTRTTETAAYWSKKLRALVDNHMRCGAEVAAELYSPAKNSSRGK